MEYLEAILKYFLTPSVGIIILGYLGRKIFEKYLEKRSDIYKKELDNQKELYKSELSKIIIAYQTKFSTLHEERRNIIRNLYEKLLEFEKIMNTAGFDIQDSVKSNKRNDIINEFFKKYIEFIEYFKKIMIYFDDEFCDKFIDFQNYYYNHLNQLRVASSHEVGFLQTGDSKLFEKSIELYEEAYDMLKDKIYPLKLEIIKSFKEYLGVLDNN